MEPAKNKACTKKRRKAKKRARRPRQPMCGNPKPRTRKNKPRGLKRRQPKARIRKNKPRGLKCEQPKPCIRKNKPRELKHRRKVCLQKKPIRPCCNDNVNVTDTAEDITWDHGFNNFLALMKEHYNDDVDEEDAQFAWMFLPEQDKLTFRNETRSPSELQIVSFGLPLPAGWRQKRKKSK